jgi:Holliday junction resolvase RusA-like endonuclease
VITTDKFTVPMQLPGLNEIIEAAKSHWSVYREMKKTYQEAVEWTAKRIAPFDRAYLDITWFEPDRRRDLDNIAAGKKFILDGLQAIGKIENDGWKQIAGFTDTFEVDKQDPRVEVKIRRA